jgi:hypothetical protein
MPWTTPYELLREEFGQRADEGCAIPEALRQRFRELHPERDAWNEALIEPLYDDLMALEEDPGYRARHPNELAEIRAHRPEGPRDLGWRPHEDELLDRLHGAWTGRCVGCALGKPVEIIGTGSPISQGRLTIKRYLQNRGDWPLRDFISARDVGDGLRITSDEPWCHGSHREAIRYMESDDDILYTLTALAVLEAHGPDFGWQEVGRFWISHIPFGRICGDATQAATNLLVRSARGWGGSATPAFTRRHRNPYREQIGGQIRSDGWGWACAGKPELAAELAWRDACWTAEGNGIYGAMMFAAIHAAAFVERDPRRLVEIGLSEIPRDCSLARCVRECLRWTAEEPDFEACMARVEGLLPRMATYHTMNNAMLCVLALVYGGLDTTRSPAIAVMCGLDTDCDGATVGAITGAAAGRAHFGGTMADRLNDTIRAQMLGFEEVRLAELARRTLAQWRRVDQYHRARCAVPAVGGRAVPSMPMTV